MKTKTVFISLFLCLLLLTGCGGSPASEKSVELSEKYDFYKDSADNIRRGCDVTSEEADDIFIILVNECGVSDLINYVSNNNDGTFSIWSSGTKYTVTLDNGIVSTVFTRSWFSDVQLYPKDESNLEYADEDSVSDVAEAPTNSTENDSEVSTDNVAEVPHRSGENIIGVSDKNISDISIYFWGDVRNDSTGNWRYSTTADDIDIESYALSYYEEYFESDDEIHCIVNFTRKTTSRLNIFGDMIFLSLYDYVDGEEHDANLMFSGTPLIDYIIYTDNGDIEKIEKTD